MIDGFIVLSSEHAKDRIIGVIEDFHWESMKENIGSLCMILENSTGKMSFRFDSQDTRSVVRALESKWKEIAPDQPFQYSFLDDEFGAMYATEQKTGQLFTAFTILAIFIAGLGLFALAAFTAEKRIKEIGIRKVLGASVLSIILMFTKDFGKLVVTAFIVAIPAAWYVVDLWLEGFAYKEVPGVGVYITSGTIALLIAWITVTYQSLKAAVTNPVNSLKDE